AALLVAVVAVRALQSGGTATVETAQATALAPRDGAPATVPVLSGSGYVVSADRYISIGVRVPGRIDRYLVEEGDHVKAGAPLVQRDAGDYEASVRRLEAMLTSARAQQTLKRAQLARARALAASKVMSRDELDIRQAEADAAVAAVGQAEADLAAAKVNLE